MGSGGEHQRASRSTAVASPVTHLSIRLFGKFTEKRINSESAILLSRTQNMLRLRPSTSFRAQSDGVSPLPHSISVGTQTAFSDSLQLLGMMTSMIAVVPLGPLKMHAFQRWTRSHRLCVPCHLQRKLTITPSCMLALLPWRDPGLLSQGSTIGRVSFSKVVYTDASLRGWGAPCDGVALRGVWTPAQRHLHINHLEMLAAFLALKHFCQVLTGQHVLIRTDNTTVVWYINKQRGTKTKYTGRRVTMRRRCNTLGWGRRSHSGEPQEDRK